MNPQDQLIEIAKLDGKRIIDRNNGFVDTFSDPDGYTGTTTKEKWLQSLPDYLHSRDAIVPVIEKQPVQIIHKVVHEIWRMNHSGLSSNPTIHSLSCLLTTPAKLCEALLRATGKWKE